MKLIRALQLEYVISFHFQVVDLFLPVPFSFAAFPVFLGKSNTAAKKLLLEILNEHITQL